MLRGDSLVRTYSRSKEVRLFPAATPEKHLRWLSALSEGASAPIIAEIRERPGASVGDLNATLGLSRKIIRRHLTLLEGEGLIAHEGDNHRRYRLGRHDGIERLHGKRSGTESPAIQLLEPDGERPATGEPQV